MMGIFTTVNADEDAVFVRQNNLTLNFLRIVEGFFFVQ